MSKKIIIIAIALLLLAAGLYAVNIFMKPQNENVPVEPAFSIEKSVTLDLPTFTGTEKVTVPNVFRNIDGQGPQQVVKDENSGATTATLRDEEVYSIYGFSGSDGSSFMLSLHAENLRQARIDGERDLVTLLGITQEQACATSSITVVIESPYDETITERYVGLSFCPSRVDLPEKVEIDLERSTQE